MFFETTYVPSPQLSAASIIDEDDLSPLPLSPSTVPARGDISGDEGMSDSPVDHIIFVIHGIGQQTEENGKFYEHIENLQETTRQVLQAKIPDHAVRIELIPIEWHRHIHDQTDTVMNRISLKSIPTIRMIENEYLADVLYYFTKERGQSIVDNVTNLFNMSYHNFLEKHPDFAGKIAIIGYSLGGIITWDILSHQREGLSAEEEAEYRKFDVNFSKLDFKPDYFFGFGSPLAAVMNIRNQSPRLYHPEWDIIFENIFHPFDPLAYRFEPLFEESYTDEAAVLVERSIPLGPSFSFPSIPFPSSGILSFFSWRAWSLQQNQREEGNLPEESIAETAESIERGEPISGHTTEDDQKTQQSDSNANDRGNEQNQRTTFLSSVNAFLQYFSSNTPVKDTNRSNDSIPGIIRWDPIQEEIREGPPPRKAISDVITTANTHRPVTRSRSQTFDAAYVVYQQHSNSKDLTDKKTKHLVEVLGIDGVRVETFERARQNFEHLQDELQEREDVAKEEEKKNEDSGDKANQEEGEQQEQEQEQEPRHEKLPCGRRIDHVLQPESFMSMIANEYLVGLRAHFSYWTSKDLLWHLVRRLEDLEEATPEKNLEPSTQ